MTDRQAQSLLSIITVYVETLGLKLEGGLRTKRQADPTGDDDEGAARSTMLWDGFLK